MFLWNMYNVLWNTKCDETIIVFLLIMKNLKSDFMIFFFFIVKLCLKRIVFIRTYHICCPLAIILNINVVFQWKQKLWERDCKYLTSDFPCKSLYTSSPWIHPFLLLDSDTERTRTQYTLSISNVSFHIKCFWFVLAGSCGELCCGSESPWSHSVRGPLWRNTTCDKTQIVTKYKMWQPTIVIEHMLWQKLYFY